MENTEIKSDRRYILYVLIVVLTGISVPLCSVLLNRGQEELVRSTLAAVFGAFIMVFVYEIQKRKGLLSYNNSFSASGFFTAYLFCLAASLFLLRLEPNLTDRKSVV